MGILRVLTQAGDRAVVWDRERVEAGEADAQEAVREAERIFEEQRAAGATAFRIAPNVPATRIDRFDPEADQIVVVPRVVGG